MRRRGNGEGTWGKRSINGTEYYVFSKYYFGKRKTFYGKTKAETLRKINEFERTSGGKTLNQNTQSVTFYEYAHNWLHLYRKKNIKPKTFDYYDSLIENYIKDTDLGRTTLKEINKLSKPQIQYLLNNFFLLYKGKSRSTNAGIYTILNQISKYGISNDDLSVNILLNIDKPSEEDVEVKVKKQRALTYEELMILWDEMLRKNTITNVIGGKIGDFVYGIAAYGAVFCGLTGLRWGEACCLQWQDIQENSEGRKFIYIDKQYVVIKDRDESENKTKYIVTTPKSKKSVRYIPLSNKAIKLLDIVRLRFNNDKDPKHLIFSTTDKPVTGSNVNRTLKSMCARAQIECVSVHELRHTFASILLNQDEKNLYTVAELLGHSSPDVTYKKYIDIFEKNKIETIDIFNNLP